MQKTLVACALALAFPVAFAQGAPSGSTVELYGILDIGVERVDVGTVSATRLQSGISAGSRLGVRGRESLGGGYTALFTLEMRVEADTGQNSNFGPLFICPPAPALCPGVTLMPPATALPPANQAAILGGNSAVNAALGQAITTVNGVGATWDRQAFAGLITPFGALLLGRQYTPGFEVMNRFNAFGDATAGQMGQGYSGLMIRANNAFQWRAEVGGITASLMYGLGGSDGSRAERATDPTAGDDFYGANLQYATRSFSVGLGYNQNKVVTYADPTTSRNGLRTLNVGATATLGNLRLFAQYMDRLNKNPILTPIDIQNIVVATGGNLAAINAVLGGLKINPFEVNGMRGVVGPVDTTVYHLGATYTIGSGVFHAAYNRAKDTSRSPWATEDASVDHMAVAYFYNLSRRTALYGAYALANNKDAARMALASAGYAGGFTTAPGEDSTAIQLGIRHSF